MSHVIAHKNPLSLVMLRLVGALFGPKPREWRDSQPDSIMAPSEIPPRNPGHPEWLGFTPEIQRLLR